MEGFRPSLRSLRNFFGTLADQFYLGQFDADRKYAEILHQKLVSRAMYTYDFKRKLAHINRESSPRFILEIIYPLP